MMIKRGALTPPRVTTQCFPRACLQKQLVDVMEVGEVRVYLEYPIRLRQDDSADEDQTDGPGQEGLDLHPGNNIVQ